MQVIKEYDAQVVIVGAGFAGLYAARELLRAGVDVLVVEGRQRVGGRVANLMVKDTVLDLGGSWLGPGQDCMFDLAKELGVGTIPYNDKGKTVMQMNGRIKQYEGLIPPLPPWSLVGLHFAISKLDKLCASIDPGTLRAHPLAQRLDSMTMATWVQRNVWTSTARKLVKIAMDGIFGVDMAEYSVWGACVLLAGVGGLTQAIDAQTLRIEGGTYGLASKLAAQLGDARVRLGKEVAGIMQDAQAVAVVGDGWSLRCRHVIIAMSPSLSQRLRYTPPLPAARDLLCQRMPMGHVWKLHAVYASAWWRDLGLCGTALTDGQTISTVVDVSPPKGVPGVLAAFAVTDNARRLSAMAQQERRTAFVACLMELLGLQAENPIAYHEISWSAEPFSRGCYSAVPSPGCLTSLGGALHTTCDRVHWAGTECAAQFWGYMEGACRSGRQAAQEVLATLHKEVGTMHQPASASTPSSQSQRRQRSKERKKL